MARLQGISGGLSGRTGNFTYRQSRGQTVVSQYQPVVKNPNTEGQQSQRARFKLMSQLAAIMAPGFGTIGVAKRAGKLKPSQRNGFVQLNMPLAVVDTENMQAKIPMERIQLTSSTKPLGTISQTSPTSTDVVIAQIPSNVTAVRVVEVIYRDYPVADASSGSFIIKTRPEIKKITDIPVADSEITYPATNDSTVLAFGLIPSESAAGKLDLTNIHTPSDEQFVGAVDLDYLVSNGALSETMTLGINVQTEGV